MKKNFRTIIIFFSWIILFLITSGSAFGQKELETIYPQIPGATGPTTSSFPIAEYVKYIYGIALGLSGVIAFLAILREGLRYLSATDKPGNFAAVRKNIQAILGGVLILIFSYLILNTINPQLVSFPEISLPEIPPGPTVTIPPATYPNSDLLRRIATMAQEAQSPVNAALTMSGQIKLLTESCSCNYTASLCVCNGGQPGSSCVAQYCYAGPGTHPCEAVRLELEASRQSIAKTRDNLLYYRNKSLAEKEDLNQNIIKVVDEKLKWIEAKIIDETRILGELESEGPKKEQQKKIDNFQAARNALLEERGYKSALVAELAILAAELQTLAQSADNFYQLPQQCVTNVKSQCQAKCKVGIEAPGANECISDVPCLYGCHNAALGCQPDTCQGGNPCPTQEMTTELLKLNGLVAAADKAIFAVIQTINAIPAQRQFNF